MVFRVMKGFHGEDEGNFGKFLEECQRKGRISGIYINFLRILKYCIFKIEFFLTT